MNKVYAFILTFFLCISIVFSMQAQNVGIGESAPNAKLDIVQTAAATALEVSQGGNGIGINLISSNATNASVGLNISQNSGLSSADGMDISMGFGSKAWGLFILHIGTDPFAHGQVIDMLLPTTEGIGYSLLHRGIGMGGSFELLNTTNISNGIQVLHDGIGRGLYLRLNNAANTSNGIEIDYDGSSYGIRQDFNGSGWGMYNALAEGVGVYNKHTALATSFSADLSDAGGTGLFVNLEGETGTGIDVRNVDNLTAPTVGGDGFAVSAYTNTQTPNSSGIVSGGILLGTQFGKGHVALLSHHADTGRGIELNMVNADNADDAIYIEHSGSGNSITARNRNSGPSRDIKVVDAVYTGSDINFTHVGVYGESSNNDGTFGFGYGVEGRGGEYGVIGHDDNPALANTAAVYANGDMTATGVKPFTIDHPQDPTQKNLRHFAIESNEVLNMYRGIVELDANGKAIVNLPSYFESINKNFTYQLTPIGTGQQPYILEKIKEDQFIVAGAPNTEVSWMVLANRNDPYIQKYPHKTMVEVNKPTHQQGKYLRPDVYDQPAEKGVFYAPKSSLNTSIINPDIVQDYANLKAKTKAIDAQKEAPLRTVQEGIEAAEQRVLEQNKK
ncbi:MAG: hypothetical protein GY810_11485 [Aureispira sp.]|nr:hypothetical protein [Aureispira sp.]